MTDATQLSDFYMLDSALKTDQNIKVSRKKKILTVNDANNTDYTSGLVEIDASSVTGSDGFSSLKEGFLTVPYVVTAKNTGTQPMAGPLSRFGCVLKTGVWNVIDSIEASLNGKTILTHDQYKSHWANFRAQTETSLTDLPKHAADTNLYPDDWFSINYIKTPSSSGDGYSNNAGTVFNVALDNTIPQSQENRALNRGISNKCENMFGVIDNTTNATFSWPSMQSKAIDQIVQQTGRGGFIEKSTAAVDSVAGIWVHLLKIRLTDLHPLFKELDLISGLAQLQLKIRFNCGAVAVAMQRTDSAGSITASGLTGGSVTAFTPNTVFSSLELKSVTLNSGKTVPIMVSGAGPDEPLSKVAPSATGGQMSFSCGVLRNSFTDTPEISKYLPYRAVTVHVPTYGLIDPRPIISKPIKEVKYLDASSHFFNNAAGSGVGDGTQMNGLFDVTIGPTYKNVKYVVAIPYPSTVDLFSSVQNVQDFQSPFSSSPWTAMAGASMSNFQFHLGADSVFDKTLDYDYEHFMSEFSKISAINGDITREHNCGLIDFMKWTYAHHVFVADCPRVSKEGVPASVRVSFTNNCSQGLSVLILIVRDRLLSIDRLTGEVERHD